MQKIFNVFITNLRFANFFVILQGGCIAYGLCFLGSFSYRAAF